MIVHSRLDSPHLANLLGDPTERDVFVYLPPGYEASDRRYPMRRRRNVCIVGRTWRGDVARGTRMGNPCVDWQIVADAGLSMP